MKILKTWVAKCVHILTVSNALVWIDLKRNSYWCFIKHRLMILSWKYWVLMLTGGERNIQGCVLWKYLWQSRKYFQSHGMIFKDQNSDRTISIHYNDVHDNILQRWEWNID